MPEEPTPAQESAQESAQEARQRAADEAARRRRLAEVFGDVLPEQTRDDAAEQTGEDGEPGESASDAWLRRQVPPHHG